VLILTAGFLSSSYCKLQGYISSWNTWHSRHKFENDVNNSCLRMRYPTVVVEQVERAIDCLSQLYVQLIDGLLFYMPNNSFHLNCC
jgi:hypothetical protein